MRPVDLERYLSAEKSEADAQMWFRTKGAMPDDPVLHRCALAYASDYSLLSASLIPHARRPFDPKLMMASLDHAVWFHRDVPRRRVAALRAGQPVGRRRARVLPRQHLQPRRRAGGVGGAGRADQGAEALI